MRNSIYNTDARSYSRIIEDENPLHNSTSMPFTPMWIFSNKCLLFQSCFTYAEINDKASSAFGTLVFLIRDFTLGGEENYGQDDKTFDEMVNLFLINRTYSEVLISSFQLGWTFE